MAEKKLVHVRSKKHWEFEIKDREQRDVPLPDALGAVLKAWFVERGSKCHYLLSCGRDSGAGINFSSMILTLIGPEASHFGQVITPAVITLRSMSSIRTA
jgi:hypothetical protein